MFAIVSQSVGICDLLTHTQFCGYPCKEMVEHRWTYADQMRSIITRRPMLRRLKATCLALATTHPMLSCRALTRIVRPDKALRCPAAASYSYSRLPLIHRKHLPSEYRWQRLRTMASDAGKKSKVSFLSQEAAQQLDVDLMGDEYGFQIPQVHRAYLLLPSHADPDFRIG